MAGDQDELYVALEMMVMKDGMCLINSVGSFFSPTSLSIRYLLLTIVHPTRDRIGHGFRPGAELRGPRSDRRHRLLFERYCL